MFAYTLQLPGGWRLYMHLERYERTMGITSRLRDGNHMLLWDFDGVELQAVVNALDRVQLLYQLPAVTVVESSSGGHYHAYCFARREWREALKAVMDTDGVDWEYVRVSALRGYFTLRISDLERYHLRYRAYLISGNPPECEPEDGGCLVDYWRRARSTGEGNRA